MFVHSDSLLAYKVQNACMCDSFNAYFVSHLVIPLTTFHTSFIILVHAKKLAVHFSAVGSTIAGVSVFNRLIMTFEFMA